MADVDDRFSNMQFLNTPERIRRIEDFSVSIRVTLWDGDIHPYLELSEAVVTTKSRLRIASKAIMRFLATLDEDEYIEPQFVTDNIETKLKRMLLYGGFMFEDETDSEYFGDEQVIGISGDELLIFPKDES